MYELDKSLKQSVVDDEQLEQRYADVSCNMFKEIESSINSELGKTIGVALHSGVTLFGTLLSIGEGTIEVDDRETGRREIPLGFVNTIVVV